MRSFILVICVSNLLGNSAFADEAIRLANNPNLSPDGNTLAFDWNGDIWSVPTAGGMARALTHHPAKDTQPKYSPDGSQIAFISDRDGSPQIYIMSADGGTPRRVTTHTAGFGLEGWTPDGTKLLARATRDNFWRHAERFLLIDPTGKSGEEMLFDDSGNHGSLSPDGRRLLFDREGTQWWRKGYHGSQAAQVWMYELDSKKFTKVCAPDRGSNSPLWKPDGSGCYIVSASNGNFNLHECNLATGNGNELTHFADDSVVQPCISKDGRTIVFRHLFDFYRYRPGSSEPPVKIDIRASGDRPTDAIERRTLASANQVSFSSDGLEIAFTSGGDLWVMDTELREPKRITHSAEEERDPVVSPDGQFIFFTSDMNGESNIWRAERPDKSKYWWQTNDFRLQRMTQDKSVKSGLKLSPDGTKLAHLRDRGDLWIMGIDGKNARRLLKSFSPIEFDWSPDGKWLVYSAEDNDFNRDIWIMPLDGSRPAYNVSRHPFNEHNPVWSPDGKVIAFTGRQGPEEIDIHYVFLRQDDDQLGSRERTLEKALEKMKLRRPTPNAERGEAAEQPADTPPAPPSPPSRKTEVVIDFDNLHERIHTISIPNSTESDLFWSANGKRLAFTATIDGRRGAYAVDFPDDLKPKLLTAATGTQARWLRSGTVVWLANGVPASFSTTGNAPSSTAGATPPAPGGRRGGQGAPRSAPTTTAIASDTPTAGAPLTEYRFQALQDYDRRQKYAAAFDLAWRTMRDNFYDERLGNRDWEAVRMKYLDAASSAPDIDTLTVVIQLMLGELNGSHLGFTPGNAQGRRGADPAATPDPANPKWTETTGHLGVRFDPTFAGPGLKIRDVLPGGPAELNRSRLFAGEIITAVDGKAVRHDMDLATVLTAPPNHESALKVKDTKGQEREVMLRPISYAAARQLLYRQWIDYNRRLVDRLSDGRLGYCHIDAMAMPSFYKFEAELFSVGAGKDGLIIDVRENGGGSTADHLLTSLCQPVHAITVPRGGTPGYPQDRKVYATWNKPIVVLCNQNSFSNAEIFSHAIKTLKRGQLVGVPTAGGVISTGAAAIMDIGMIRLPGRGWYLLNDGRDMELNGAVPDHIVWPEPGQMPAGKDVQLEKAVSVLRADVSTWQSRPQAKMRKASEIELQNKSERPVVTTRTDGGN